MKPVRFLRPAELELLDSAQYYELQAHGLGNDFLDMINLAIREIQENPARWPILRDDTRRYPVRRFPYALLYREDPCEIIIQATMNLRRRPDYWFDR